MIYKLYVKMKGEEKRWYWLNMTFDSDKIILVWNSLTLMQKERGLFVAMKIVGVNCETKKRRTLKYRRWK